MIGKLIDIKIIIIIIILVVSNNNIFTQQNENYIIQLNSNVNYKFSNFDSCKNKLNYYIDSLRNIGYLNASFESKRIENHIIFYLLKNNLFYKKTDDKENILTFQLYNDYKFKILTKYLNAGYPFTNIIEQNKNIINDSIININLIIDSGQLFTIGDIDINDSKGIDYSLISKVISIKKGDPFDLSKIENIDNLIRNDKNLELMKVTEYYFNMKDAITIRIFVKKKTKTHFDFIIGLNNNSDNKMYLSSLINLSFANIITSHSYIGLEINRLKAENQEYSIKIKRDYVFSSFINFQYNFYNNRIDSTFNKFQNNLQLNYKLNSNNHIGIGLNYENIQYNSVIYNTIIASNQNKFLYGVVYTFDNSKYTNTFISTGNMIELKLYNGNKKTNYENFFSKSNNILFEANIINNILLKNDLSVKNNFYIYNNISDKSNDFEKKYFGGAKTLRAFNENSFKSNNYYSNSVDLTKTIGSNFALNYFFDISYIADNNNINIPIGTGVGLSIKMRKNFIIKIDYGIPIIKSNKFDFRNNKLHINFYIQ